jgi:hypothetical protein
MWAKLDLTDMYKSLHRMVGLSERGLQREVRWPVWNAVAKGRHRESYLHAVDLPEMPD